MTESEKLEQRILEESKRFPEVSFAKLSRIAKHFYELGQQAGAKWMAEHGVTSEGIVEEQSHSAGLTGRYFVAEVERNKLDDFINDNFQPGDKVVVQIRKKEE